MRRFDPTMTENIAEDVDDDEAAEQGDESDGQHYAKPQEVQTSTGGKMVIAPHADDPPPYHEIVIPDNKSGREFNTYERRAELLRRVERAGHPRAVPSTYKELGDEFGVAKSTIAADMRRLSEYVAENVTRDHVTIMDSVFRGAILDLVEDGKKAWAAEVGREWYEWLADMGEIERVADEVNLDATVRDASTSTDHYSVISDDEAEPVDAEFREVDEQGDDTDTDEVR